MAIGRDMRLSSPEIAGRRLSRRRAAEARARMSSTWVSRHRDALLCRRRVRLRGRYPGHRLAQPPRQYNGMKIVRRGAMPVGGGHRPRQHQGVCNRAGAPCSHRHTPESARPRDAPTVIFANGCLQFIDSCERWAPLAGRADGGQRHGRADDHAAPGAPADPGPLPSNLEPDRHLPQPRAQPAARGEPGRSSSPGCSREGAILGIAWDGDADRCFFIDDPGRVVPGDLITALMAETDARSQTRASAIVYDLRASWAVRDTMREGGRGGPSRTASATRSSRPGSGRRTRSSPARCRGTTTSRDFYYSDTGYGPGAGAARAGVPRPPSRCRSCSAPFRERYFISGEVNSHLVSDVPLKLQELKERYGPSVEARLPPGRDLVRVRRLALQRPAVEHRAAAAPQPGGARCPDDGSSASTRCSRTDPGRDRLNTHRPPAVPVRLPASRVGFDETDAQGIVYYGRYMPYFDRARVEYQRHLGLLVHEPNDPEFVMRAQYGRVPRARAVRRRAGGVCPRRCALAAPAWGGSRGLQRCHRRSPGDPRPADAGGRSTWARRKLGGRSRPPVAEGADRSHSNSI